MRIRPSGRLDGAACRTQKPRPVVRDVIGDVTRERGDPAVPVQVEGVGSAHAAQPQSVQVGGDPARHRLHLRPADGAGEQTPPPGGSVFRRRGRGVADGRRFVSATTARSASGQSERGGHLRSSGGAHLHFCHCLRVEFALNPNFIDFRQIIHDHDKAVTSDCDVRTIPC